MDNVIAKREGGHQKNFAFKLQGGEQAFKKKEKDHLQQVKFT